MRGKHAIKNVSVVELCTTITHRVTEEYSTNPQIQISHLVKRYAKSNDRNPILMTEGVKLMTGTPILMTDSYCVCPKIF